MTTPFTIEHIADYVGRRVTVKGWLYQSTPKGKLLFLRLRDGTGTVSYTHLTLPTNREV